jgi:hypothetical protein
MVTLSALETEIRREEQGYLRQPAMTKMNPGARLGIADAMAGDVFFMPCSIRAWNKVTLHAKHKILFKDINKGIAVVGLVSYPPRDSKTN